MLTPLYKKVIILETKAQNLQTKIYLGLISGVASKRRAITVPQFDFVPVIKVYIMLQKYNQTTSIIYTPTSTWTQITKTKLLTTRIIRRLRAQNPRKGNSTIHVLGRT